MFNKCHMVQVRTHVFFWNVDGHIKYGHSLNTRFMNDVSPHAVNYVMFIPANNL
jgi:hypothetical protein